MEYIILNNEKKPLHKFKNAEDTKTYNEVKNYDNYAVIVPKGYVVLDFDTTDDAKIMLDIVNKLDLKTKIIETNRGYHFWFKCSNSFKNFTKARLAIGIYSDCKSGCNEDKRAYVVLKQNGKKRKVIRNFKLEELEELPRFLYPISTPSGKFEFKEMGEGDGRNQELFNYIVYMQSKDFKKEEIKETLDVINDFVFEEALSDSELKQLMRDESFKSDEEIQAGKNERLEGFKHNVFGNELIDNFKILTLNNQLYIYEDGYYQRDERIVERKMISMFPSIKNNQRNEVLSYIKIMTHVNSADIEVNPYILNLKNTRLDIRNQNQLEFTSDAIEFDRIPVVFDPDAYCEDLDKMLNRVFLYDEDVIKLFEEMIGACLIKHARYQKAFMLYGNGSNGKSTILELVKKFLGSRNYTSIELDKLSTDRFAPAELENKLANIGDDLNSTSLKDTGTLKKLFSGNSLQVQRKNEQPFDLVPYATHIYSANEIPRSFDKSSGFYRRWVLIPFNAKFSKDDADYDPLIEDKLTTDKALSYLLNKAIAGAQRLMQKRWIYRTRNS